ncbi:MAG: type II toxin-antitoxin system RelE/ParE family toxin [bacterium]|nr:type II toxin-antitoxin system RelE/ParE family toxin [bacterium]MCY3631857.1 type II toxin-antitoxin system RelE/ParE family toxin [bacterium]
MAKLARRAEKDLNDLPEALAVKAKEIIRRLDHEPHLGKKLSGPLQGKRSTRLGRSHRIIYTASEGQVIVLTISHRRDAYR